MVFIKGFMALWPSKIRALGIEGGGWGFVPLGVCVRGSEGVWAGRSPVNLGMRGLSQVLVSWEIMGRDRTLKLCPKAEARGQGRRSSLQIPGSVFSEASANGLNRLRECRLLPLPLLSKQHWTRLQCGFEQGWDGWLNGSELSVGGVGRAGLGERRWLLVRMSHDSTHRQAEKMTGSLKRELQIGGWVVPRFWETKKSWHSKREIKGILPPRFWNLDVMVAGERFGCSDNAWEISTGVSPRNWAGLGSGQCGVVNCGQLKGEDQNAESERNFCCRHRGQWPHPREAS